MAREGQGYPCCQHDMMMMMKLNVLTLARITTIMYEFFTCAHIQIFFSHLAFLIIGSHIVFNSILGLLSRSL